MVILCAHLAACREWTQDVGMARLLRAVDLVRLPRLGARSVLGLSGAARVQECKFGIHYRAPWLNSGAERLVSGDPYPAPARRCQPANARTTAPVACMHLSKHQRQLPRDWPLYLGRHR